MTQVQTNQRADIKVDDLEPPLEFRLYDGDAPLDLTNASSILFHMKGKAGLKVTNGSCVPLDQSDPLLRGRGYYAWVLGDTDTKGEFKGEIEVVWPGVRPQTFPKRGYIKIVFGADLADPPIF